MIHVRFPGSFLLYQTENDTKKDEEDDGISRSRDSQGTCRQTKSKDPSVILLPNSLL